MGNVSQWHTWNKLGLLFLTSVTLQLEGRALLAGRLQSKAEDSGVFDGSCVLQLPPVNRYPWAPLFPWLCFHLIVFCCYWSTSVNRTQSRVSACDHAPRPNLPQFKSQKKAVVFSWGFGPAELMLLCHQARLFSGETLNSTWLKPTWEQCAQHHKSLRNGPLERTSWMLQSKS